MESYVNKKIQILSFSVAFLLHALFLIFLFFDFHEIKLPSKVEVSAISIVSEKEKLKSGRKTIPLPSSHSSFNQNENNEDLDHNLDSKNDEGANLIYNPLPKIPDDLRQEAFQSEAIARFHIAPSGEVINVDLVKPCANPKLNYLLLKALRQWKFSPKLFSSTKEIKVKFSVE